MADTRASGAPITVEGTGPVAMALLLWLARQGVGACRVRWIGEPRPVPPSLGARAIALSAGSVQRLNRIAPALRGAPIDTVEARVRGHAGRLRMRAAEMGVAALGRVIRYADLHETLRLACAARGFTPEAGEADDAGASALHVLADGEPGAHGHALDFGQDALVAEVRASGPVPGAAFECFLPGGPLALLPLPQPGDLALVWCDAPSLTAVRMAMPADEFCAALAQSFGPGLGEFTLVSERDRTALVRRLRPTAAGDARIAIGNAAQTLHPVAGQGLNLGLRDAFTLASHLGDAQARRLPPASALAGYARARVLDRRLSVTVTDALARAFSASSAGGPGSIALAALDLLGPLRRAIAARFMHGFGGV